MAKEYIEREAALEIAMQYCPDDDGSCSKADADLREMLDEIEAIPTADVVPLIHATWETDTCHFYCSECEQYVDYKTNYCPNCGARMDGDGDV